MCGPEILVGFQSSDVECQHNMQPPLWRGAAVSTCLEMNEQITQAFWHLSAPGAVTACVHLPF